MIYENLGIHDLITIARQKGVKAPTTKTKPQLISEIKLIDKGLQQPYFSTKKQGRPVKVQIELDEYKRELMKTVKMINKSKISYKPFKNISEKNKKLVNCLNNICFGLDVIKSSLKDIIESI